MNLQEQILRMKSMMGIIKENIDDLLDKMNRGEELTSDEKNKMQEYSEHIKNGGTDDNFNYKGTTQNGNNKVETTDNEVDVNSLLEQNIYKYYEDRYKNSYYIEGTESYKNPFTSLLKVKKIEDEGEESQFSSLSDEEESKELNSWLFVCDKSRNQQNSESQLCSIAIKKDLISGNNYLFWNNEWAGFSNFIEKYVENNLTQKEKEQYDKRQGLFYYWEYDTDYKDRNEILQKVFIGWLKNKFPNENFNYDDAPLKINDRVRGLSKRFLKENGITGYIKDL